MNLREHTMCDDMIEYSVHRSHTLEWGDDGFCMLATILAKICVLPLSSSRQVGTHKASLVLSNQIASLFVCAGCPMPQQPLPNVCVIVIAARIISIAGIVSAHCVSALHVI